MRLIGMLDSPYVRRVAISLQEMGLAYEHSSISVFRQFEEFASINPVVKAPSMVTDDGTVLMDSGLMLDYLERLAPPGRSLMPADIAGFAKATRVVGLAMAACEKSVQIVYERRLRPLEKQHQPWIDRVLGQLTTAYRLLEAEYAAVPGWMFGDRIMQADISAAVAWRFTQELLPSEIHTDGHSALAALSARAEALPSFQACPFAG